MRQVRRLLQSNMAAKSLLLVFTLLKCLILSNGDPVQMNSKAFGRIFRFNSNLMLPFYFQPLVMTTTYTTTVLIPTTFTNTIDSYCIAGSDPAAVLTTCTARRRRSALEEDEEIVYIDNQPFKPSQVSRMLVTEMPRLAKDIPMNERLISSIESAKDDNERQNRKLKGEWLFATTSTVTLTAVTVVNSTQTDPLYSILITGCIPDCLTSLAICPPSA